MGCVYKIENKITGKVYIGSTNDFYRRKHEHFWELMNKSHHSIKLQSDYDKYGEENFSMSIIEECEDSIRLDREQHYIDLYDAANKGYNTSDSAYFSKAGFCTMDKDGENNPFYGKHHSEETRQKLRETWELTREERSGFTHSEETKDKIRKTKIGKKNPNATHILQYDLDGNFLKEWDCIADIVEFYGMSGHSHVSNCCERNIGRTEKFCRSKGFIWRYADKPKRKNGV